MKRYLFLSLSCFFSLLLQSQSVDASKNIEGVLIDEAGTPIQGATIVHIPSSRSTVSGEDGNFVIVVPESATKLVIRRIGFAQVEHKIEEGDRSGLRIEMQTQGTTLNEVTVRAVRATSSTPITYSDVSEEDLGERNLGQDMPILLNYLPSVVTTSDAGAGVGYTGIRVRGSDATRINVTINGIPYNDSESQGVFWVNLPDFASSIGSAQLQRGVGSSTNGSGAFGASLNLLTDGLDQEGSASISNSFGSFSTRRHQLEFNTGTIGKRFSVSGRLSRIASDGYVDRARSDLYGYYLQGVYAAKRAVVKAITFGGREETYQAWYGIDGETLANDRTFNSAGIYTDDDGNVQFYDKEVDNYGQDHFQLHWLQKLDNDWNTNLAAHFTFGKGYFEQFKEDADMSFHGLEPLILDTTSISTTDLIRRRWLDNDFYGITGSLEKTTENFNWVTGFAWNQYRGDHFGEVIWARFASNSEIRDRYYDDKGEKDEFNLFSKFLYRASDKFMVWLDMQLRGVDYRADGVSDQPVDDGFVFFNPKAGLSYELNKGDVYLSYARAHREPTRTDYENGNPVPEILDNIELGWRGSAKDISWSTNLYYMYYTEQLVLTGALDDVGAPIRENIGSSYRAGIELDLTFRIIEQIEWRPNVAFSVNKNLDFFLEAEEGVADLGDTEIAYSPDIVFGNSIMFRPIDHLEIGLYTKYVGEQYMSNIEAGSSLLDSYLVNDMKIGYSIFPRSNGIKRIGLDLLVNNLLDEKYVSNGYWFDGYAGYYPQAGINFLAGLTLDF